MFIKSKTKNNGFFEFQYIDLLKSAFENEIFLVARNFLKGFLILKMDLKMNLRIITKNRRAVREIRFLTKTIKKSYGALRPCRQRGS